MTTPEARARQNIDLQLTACGWVVQDSARMNLYTGRGVAVREFPLQAGYANYLLFIDRKAAGVLEAKAEGTPLTGMALAYSLGDLLENSLCYGYALVDAVLQMLASADLRLDDYQALFPQIAHLSISKEFRS